MNKDDIAQWVDHLYDDLSSDCEGDATKMKAAWEKIKVAMDKLMGRI